MNFHSYVKSQSAIEYLLTYGWAILIIAIVVIALFQLGLIGGPNLSSKATAGACQVVKTAQGSVLAGQCNGEQPNFVAQFGGAGSVTTGTTGLAYGNPQVSMFAWIYWNKASDYQNIYVYADNSWDAIALAEEPIGSLCANIGEWASPCPSPSLIITPNTWEFVGLTHAGGSTFTIYLDGQSSVESASDTLAQPSISSIGGSYGGWQPFTGSIADLQVYNTSLSANEVQALYQEGIGGAPIDPTHIVGWWPLNGNAQDYSGNKNQGTATSVSYNSSWSSGYVLT